MAARKRKNNESFEKYRANLKREDVLEKEQLKGKMLYRAVEMIKILNPKYISVWKTPTESKHIYKAISTGPAIRSMFGGYNAQK